MAKASIVKGSDVLLHVQIVDHDTKEPFNLNGLVNAIAKFANTDGTTLSITGVLVSADCGKLDFPLTAAQTALLASGELQSFQVTITKSGEIKVVLFPEALEILEQLL